MAIACVAVALLCGLVSLVLGQDRNWDLRNYHLYNAYAWLNDRLGYDLAAAQLQSYFTPLLDVPYFWMATRWSAPSAGFVLGAFHGLAFACAAAVAWRALEGEPRRPLLAPLLALAGCMGAAFLSGLGNTMGDNATSVLVLAAVCLVLPHRRDESANPLPRVLLAGLLLGAAVGLKLTNAPYAVGMGAAVMAFPPAGTSRPKAIAWLVGAAAASFLLVAGPWFWSVWEAFGNPLFPQFNAAFRAPLAQPISVADSKWGPQGLGEALSWPVLFTLDPDRVSNSPLPQVIWPVLYLVGLYWLGRRLLRRWRRPAESPAPTAVNPALGFLLVFVPVSFVVWMSVFGIYRYLVVLELLAPLLLWLGLKPVFPRAARYVVLACVAVSLLGWNTWGHAGWSDRGFAVQSPAIDGPGRTATVALVGGEPMAWMIPFLPEDIAFVSLGSNFPQSPAYAARVREMMVDRGGGAYAIIPAAIDKRAARVQRIDSTLQSLGLSGGAGSCARLQWLVERSGFEAQVTAVSADGGVCRLQLPVRRRLDVVAENRILAANAEQAVGNHGMRLDVEQCRVYAASIGTDQFPYQWCPLELTAPP